MDPFVIQEPEVSADPRRKVILIVEEDFLARWSAAEYLREIGFDVIEAVSAAEGVAALRAGSVIDAIFCDAGTISGREEQEFHLALKQRPNLPFLLASDAADGGGMLAPLPPHCIIAKPYALVDVERRLHEIIGAG